MYKKIFEIMKIYKKTKIRVHPVKFFVKKNAHPILFIHFHDFKDFFLHK